MLRRISKIDLSNVLYDHKIQIDPNQASFHGIGARQLGLKQTMIVGIQKIFSITVHILFPEACFGYTISEPEFTV